MYQKDPTIMPFGIVFLLEIDCCFGIDCYFDIDLLFQILKDFIGFSAEDAKVQLYILFITVNLEILVRVLVL